MAQIEILEPQSRWPAEFAAAGARLRQALGPLALAINHIGSTSVPGLDAKDVIDLQVSVAALDLDLLKPAIDAAGYRIGDELRFDHVPAGEDPNPDLWAKFRAAAPKGGRRTHIHIRVRGRPNERYAMLFRDFLRATQPAAASYALIKRELAAATPTTSTPTTRVKDPVCDLDHDRGRTLGRRSRLDATAVGRVAASGIGEIVAPRTT
jgi:GrpB-like predicted nucleotidyltransferase (UPF0157 family)